MGTLKKTNLSTWDLLRHLAEEAMSTALAKYMYYTANDEVIPPIDMIDTISNVWGQNRGYAGARLTKEEVLEKDVNPTGAILSDYINSLATDIVIKHNEINKFNLLSIVNEGIENIILELKKLEEDVNNVVVGSRHQYRFVLRPEPEYLRETFLYYAEEGCQISFEEFANYRVFTDKLVDRPYIPGVPLTREDLQGVTRVIYWSSYEYSNDDYTVGKWLSTVLADVVNKIRKEDIIAKNGKLTVEENIKTIEVIDFYTPYIGSIWKFQELLDKLGQEKVIVVDNITNTCVDKYDIFQDIEIKALKFDTNFLMLENSNIGMFINSMKDLYRYIDNDTMKLLRIYLEKYKKVNKGTFFNYRTEILEKLADVRLQEYTPDLVIEPMVVPPLDKGEMVVADLPTIEELMEEYERNKEKEKAVSETFIPDYENDLTTDPDIYVHDDETEFGENDDTDEEYTGTDTDDTDSGGSEYGDTDPDATDTGDGSGDVDSEDVYEPDYEFYTPPEEIIVSGDDPYIEPDHSTDTPIPGEDEPIDIPTSDTEDHDTVPDNIYYDPSTNIDVTGDGVPDEPDLMFDITRHVDRDPTDDPVHDSNNPYTIFMDKD